MIPTPTHKTYQMSVIWRLWFGIAIIISIAIIAGLLYSLIGFDYNLGDWESWAFIIFVLLGIAMTGHFALHLLDIVSGRLYIAADGMVYKSFVRQRKILFTEIRGYQAAYSASISEFNGNKEIAIIPTVGGNKRKIKISPYVENHAELMEWLSRHFKSLLGRKHIDG